MGNKLFLHPILNFRNLPISYVYSTSQLQHFIACLRQKTAMISRLPVEIQVRLLKMEPSSSLKMTNSFLHTLQ